MQVTTPEGWDDEEVHFIWDSEGEALVFTETGDPIQAFNGATGDERRDVYVLSKSAKSGEQYNFFVEMVCCQMFGVPGPEGFLAPPNPKKSFTLKKAEVARFNRSAWNLYRDLGLIVEMIKELPEDDVRAWQAYEVARKIVNTTHTSDHSTFAEAQSLADAFLAQTNGEMQHKVTAIGHCHIDTAWLWPYSETRRKCARR